MSEQHKPWDERLLERLQRGNDRVAEPGWVRLLQAVSIGTVTALNVGRVTAWWLVWPAVSVLLLVSVRDLVAKARARRKRR
jgi:hypothetical protein